MVENSRFHIAYAVIFVLFVLMAGCQPDAEIRSGTSILSEAGTEGHDTEYIEPHITNSICRSEDDCGVGMKCALLPGKTQALCVDDDICRWACAERKCTLAYNKFIIVDCSGWSAEPASAGFEKDSGEGSKAGDVLNGEMSSEMSGKTESGAKNLSYESLDEDNMKKDGNNSKSSDRLLTKEGLYKIYVGKPVDVYGHRFEITSFSNNPISVRFYVDARKGEIVETKYWEILNGLKIKLISFELHGYKSTDTFGVFEIEPLNLGEEQYFIEKKYPVTVLGNVIELNQVKSDGRAYISIPSKKLYWESFKPGETKIIDGLKISLIESFYKTRDYAIFAITSVNQ